MAKNNKPSKVIYIIIKGKGSAPKIVTSWDVCSKAVTGFSKPMFKGFTASEYAGAAKYIMSRTQGKTKTKMLEKLESMKHVFGDKAEAKKSPKAKKEKKKDVAHEGFIQVHPGADKPNRLPCTLDFYPNLESRIGYPFTEDQKDIIECCYGKSLTKATAGAGKTTTMTAKIGRMVLVEKIHPKRILAMSFSKMSAKDLEKRYKELFPEPEAQGVEFKTIHAFAYKVVQDQYRKLRKSVKLIDKAIDEEGNPLSDNRLIGKIYFELHNKYLKNEESADIINDIGIIKNRMLKPHQVGSNFSDIDKIYESYEAEKKRLGVIDYGDMLTECYRFLSSDHEILGYYGSMYDHIILDEAQDTSTVQGCIMALLATISKNLTLVGDDDQAIYPWRGADPEFLVYYTNNNPETVAFDLGVNYRCPQNVVKYAMTLIEYNQIRLEKPIQSFKKTDGKIVDMVCKSYSEQINEVSSVIHALNKNDLNDTAILFRNNMSAIPLIDMLYESGIDFYVRGDRFMAFFNNWLFADIMRLLRLFHDPSDKETFVSLASRLGIRIRKDILLRLPESRNAVKAALSIEKLSDRNKTKIMDLLRSIDEFEFRDVSGSIRYILDKTKYSEYVKKREQSDMGSGVPADMIRKIMSQLGSRSLSIPEYHEKMINLKAYIEKLSKSRRKRTGVSLLTIHSSKGLEFENVLIVDMVEDVLPSKSVGKDKKKLEEERRLCYVAITRAKENLYMYSLDSGDSKPSRFLQEMVNTNPCKSSNERKTSEVDPIRSWDYGNKVVPADKPKLAAKTKVNSAPLIKSESELTAGLRVSHDKFGSGSVKTIDELKVIIAFDEGKQRTFLVSFVVGNGMLYRI